MTTTGILFDWGFIIIMLVNSLRKTLRLEWKYSVVCGLNFSMVLNVSNQFDFYFSSKSYVDYQNLKQRKMETKQIFKLQQVYVWRVFSDVENMIKLDLGKKFILS